MKKQKQPYALSFAEAYYLLVKELDNIPIELMEKVINLIAKSGHSVNFESDEKYKVLNQ